MNEHDELPSERRLSDQTRARVRAELLHAAEARRRPGRRGWVPVAVAAAAGVAVVGLGTALLVDGLDSEGDGEGRPVPAGQVTEPPAAPTPSAPPTPDPDPEESAPDAVTSSEAVDVRAGSCDALPQTRRAEPAGAIEIGPTTVRLYENGLNWFVCDEWAALDGGDATLFPDHRLGSALVRDHLVISMNFSMDRSEPSQYVAGGALPDDLVQAISYEFPDGHVEQAVVEDGMWAMAYFATEKPMGDDGRVPTNAETTVTVDYADGSQQEFVLEYPTDFCAQVNHGC